MKKLTKAEHLEEARKRIEELKMGGASSTCWLCKLKGWDYNCRDGCFWYNLTGHGCDKEHSAYLSRTPSNWSPLNSPKGANLIRDVVIPRIEASPETHEVFRQEFDEQKDS